jgi:hypothetical protein
VKTKVVYLIALIMPAILCWLLSIFIFGWSLSPGVPILLAIAAGFLAVALVVATRQLSAWVWFIAGLLILAGLVVLPTSLLVETEKTALGSLSQTLETLLSITIFMMLPVALVVAAVLLQSGVKFHQERQDAKAIEDGGSGAKRVHAGRAAVFFLLSALLIGMTLQNFYWLMVWDSTYDGLQILWLFVPVMAALFAGVLLFFNLQGWTRWAGLSYALLIPALLMAVYTRAQQVDFRQLTEERAGRVSQAVEAYYARQGRYPQDLRQLIPRYLLALPEPVIINGQGWCYDGGETFYRLGTVYRDHWSSPMLVGRVYATKGEAPDLPPACDQEIEGLRKRSPGFYGDKEALK